MKYNEHILNLGELIATFHNLEFVLRAFLLERNSNTEPEVDHESIHEGEWIEVNSFTNYDTLGQLIRKFNLVVEDSFPNFVIDTSVVKTRDALAHGRIAGKSLSVLPLSLLKFGRPKKGKVQARVEVVMDLKWFKDNLSIVHEQIKKVVNASKSLGMKNIEWV